MKRSLFERAARKIPLYRKELLRKARVRRFIRKLENKAKQIAIDLRTAPEDKIRGMVMEIGMISMVIAIREQEL